MCLCARACVSLSQREDEVKYEGNCVIVPIGGPLSSLSGMLCCFFSLCSLSLQYWNEYPFMFIDKYYLIQHTPFVIDVQHVLTHTVLCHAVLCIQSLSQQCSGVCLLSLTIRLNWLRFEYSKRERPWASVSPHPTSCVLRKLPFFLFFFWL